MADKTSFKTKFYEDIAPVATGLGASVVILGALFKIQHYPGAGIMLNVGLITESLLFVMFAFAPKPKHEVGMEDWVKVYPQLSDDYFDDQNLSKNLDEMMASANINQGVIDRLGEGLNNLASNVESMKSLSDASVATSDYAANAQEASASLRSMSNAYKSTAEAMNGMASAASDATEYHAQVQNITKNLSSLNAVYEMELQDANQHLKVMNKFYGNLSIAMENMAEASKDTDHFKRTLASLTSNLTELNTVYGNMLSAMKGVK